MLSGVKRSCFCVPPALAPQSAFDSDARDRKGIFYFDVIGTWVGRPSLKFYEDSIFTLYTFFSLKTGRYALPTRHLSTFVEALIPGHPVENEAGKFQWKRWIFLASACPWRKCTTAGRRGRRAGS